MLHELLLALSGFPGSVFVEDARTGIVKVAKYGSGEFVGQGGSAGG